MGRVHDFGPPMLSSPPVFPEPPPAPQSVRSLRSVSNRLLPSLPLFFSVERLAAATPTPQGCFLFVLGGVPSRSLVRAQSVASALGSGVALPSLRKRAPTASKSCSTLPRAF